MNKCLRSSGLFHTITTQNITAFAPLFVSVHFWHQNIGLARTWGVFSFLSFICNIGKQSGARSLHTLPFTHYLTRICLINCGIVQLRLEALSSCFKCGGWRNLHKWLQIVHVRSFSANGDVTGDKGAWQWNQIKFNWRPVTNGGKGDNSDDGKNIMQRLVIKFTTHTHRYLSDDASRCERAVTANTCSTTGQVVTEARVCFWHSV